MAYHEYFPEEFIQLQLEIEKHPLLIQRLQKHAGLGLEVIFAETCHYCSYAIDGEFTPDELVRIADKLIWKLRSMPVKQAIKNLSDDWSKEAWKFGVQ